MGGLEPHVNALGRNPVHPRQNKQLHFRFFFPQAPTHKPCQWVTGSPRRVVESGWLLRPEIPRYLRLDPTLPNFYLIRCLRSHDLGVLIATSNRRSSTRLHIRCESCRPNTAFDPFPATSKTDFPPVSARLRSAQPCRNTGLASI